MSTEYTARGYVIRDSRAGFFFASFGITVACKPLEIDYYFGSAFVVDRIVITPSAYLIVDRTLRSKHRSRSYTLRGHRVSRVESR